MPRLAACALVWMMMRSSCVAIAGIVPPFEQLLHARDIVGVHVPLGGKRDVGRFLIRALAQAHAGAERNHVRHVLLGAAQVGLQDDTDGIAVLGMKSPREKLKRALRVRRGFHVDADKRRLRRGARGDRAHVLNTFLLVDVEPHLRELQGHVGVRAGGLDAVERLEIRVAGRLRFRRLAAPPRPGGRGSPRCR